MSGGNRRVIFNTRERVVSSDQTRHQSFQALERAEILRYQGMLRATPLGSDLVELENGSYVDTTAAAAAGITTPGTGDVIDGLVVFPVSGTLNLLVSPGMVLLNDPDGQSGSSDPSPPSSDDSRAKLVLDPGIVVSGALSIAAGAGSTRIDLVEVRRTTLVLETDSRDIFDPSTGTFVPVTVPKVSEGRLLYRVTQGTPGAGIPARSKGWLPICVASVPSSSVATDTMRFWDVRPLIKDRVNAPHESRHSTQILSGDHSIFADAQTTPGTTFVSGLASGQIGMYRAGGTLFFNAQNVANQEAGFAPTNGRPWYIYAVFPASLPRWVEYSSSPPRVPGGALGLITVSAVGPTANPLAMSINPPASSGLGVAGPAALLAAAAYQTEPRGFVAQEGLCLVDSGNEIIKSPASSTATTDFYTLVSNQDFPATARFLRLKIAATFSGVAATDNLITMSLFLLIGGTTTPRYAEIGVARVNDVMPASGSFIAIYYVDVPRMPFTVSDVSFEVNWGSSVTRASATARIMGWRI